MVIYGFYDYGGFYYIGLEFLVDVGVEGVCSYCVVVYGVDLYNLDLYGLV